LVGVRNEDERLIRPDGLVIRGLRHTRGWSLRDLSAAISEAHESATGLPVRLAPRLLASVEERNALISYATLCWIGSGLDCNPVEILLEDPPGVPSAAP
jgi:transcriptional regulator with XRE-family HTH domain